MNETTEKLIRDLAERLGTTAEHLWSVLIRQAPITAITNLLECLILVAVCVYYRHRLVLWQKRLRDTCDADHPALPPAYIGLVVLLCITIIHALLTASGIVTAFANPEYWALKQIVK